MQGSVKCGPVLTNGHALSLSLKNSFHSYHNGMSKEQLEKIESAAATVRQIFSPQNENLDFLTCPLSILRYITCKTTRGQYYIN